MNKKLEKVKKEFIKNKFPKTDSDKLWNELNNKRQEIKELKKALKNIKIRIDILLKKELDCYPRYELLMLRDTLNVEGVKK